MLESYQIFKRRVDELIQYSENDPELAESIKWLDMQASKKNISFYHIVLEVLYQNDIKEKAKDWLEKKHAIV